MSVRQTSIDAFNAIKDSGLLSTRRWQVYEYLFKNGPCTAKQVTGNLRSGLQDSGGYNTRLSELRRMGVVQEVGKVECPESGHNVILWDVTDKMPKKLHKDLLLYQLEELGLESLDQYYFTEHWVDFKDGYYTRHPRVCYISGATTRLHLHHITYERLGAELDEDVVPLHEFWHKVVHHLVKEHKVKLEIAHKVAKVVYQATGKWEEINL